MSATKAVKIVVVEDETFYNDLISKVLAQENDLEVIGSYSSAKKAKIEIPTIKPDVALVDIELGSDLNGIQLALNLREKLSNLGIVLLSNHTKLSFARLLARRELAGWAYLLKPSVSSFDTLRRTIFSVTQGEIILDEQLIEQLNNSPNDFTNSLTPRQIEILGLLAQGYANTAIAEKLGLARRSVENQLSEIYAKLALNKQDENINLRVKAVLMHLENQFW